MGCCLQGTKQYTRSDLVEQQIINVLYRCDLQKLFSPSTHDLHELALVGSILPDLAPDPSGPQLSPFRAPDPLISSAGQHESRRLHTGAGAATPNSSPTCCELAQHITPSTQPTHFHVSLCAHRHCRGCCVINPIRNLLWT